MKPKCIGINNCKAGEVIEGAIFFPKCELWPEKGMCEKKAEYQVIQFAKDYLSFGQSMPDSLKKDLVKLFRSCEILILEKAFSIHRLKYPATYQDISESGEKIIYRFGGKMPPIKLIENVYKSLITQPIPNCACCGKSGWIYGENDIMKKCDCRKGGVKSCKNYEHCEETEDLKCPFGEQHYNEKKREYSNNLKQEEELKIWRKKEKLNCTKSYR